MSPKELQTQNDFQSVSRFDNFGGGWGYSGHSVEAIRFMTDTDVLLCKCNEMNSDRVWSRIAYMAVHHLESNNTHSFY